MTQNHLLSIKELRQFGLMVGGIFSVIGLWPVLVHGGHLRWWALILGMVLMGLGAAIPGSLRHVYKGWMAIGHVLGFINTRILLGVIFYGLITPMGLVMRLMGKDSMRRVLVEEVATYRVTRVPRPRHHMLNQY